jgi:hypothetical protein
MSQLTIKNRSAMERKLYDEWRASPATTWVMFIKSLDKNIISVRYLNPYTNIWFDDDACKTWFILRWS